MSLASREPRRRWPRRLTLALCLLAAPAFAQASPPPDPGAPLPYVIGLHEAYVEDAIATGDKEAYYAGVIGGPLAGFIMTQMHGVNGWAGWQWVFLLEGSRPSSSAS